MKVVKLLDLHTGRIYPQEILLVLLSARGSVEHRVIVRPERLCLWKIRQWKIPMKPSGIESATFRLVIRTKKKKKTLQYRFCTFLGEIEFYTEQVFWNVSKNIQIWSSLNKYWYQTLRKSTSGADWNATSVNWRNVIITILQLKNTVAWYTRTCCLISWGLGWRGEQ